MPTTLRTLLGLASFAAASSMLFAQPADSREDVVPPPALDAPAPDPTDGPVIKLALLLDTSNSMDGLINQARTRLWKVVNTMGAARADGVVPQLQVALFQYGNSRLEAADDYVQLRCPFTTDLDVVSEQLFGLSTNGGSEYCGAVIREAMQRLDWGNASAGPVLRVIVVAGNEPFNQGSEPYAESIATARGLEVRVNTIFCGAREEGRRTLWADGARLGEGHFAAIDQNQAVPEIETPFDETLMELNEALNGTYLGYGQRGKRAEARQRTQDAVNSSLSYSAGISRIEAKTTSNYATSSWDLVSAVEAGEVELEDLETEALPEALRGMSADEREAELAKLRAERSKLTERIRELTARRSQFIAAARKDQAASAPDLDDALISALQAQGAALGFTFSE